MGSKASISCSFCGKAREDVFKLIVRDQFAICDGCVEICSKALQKERQKVDIDEYSNHVNPIEIKKYLDRFVIGQDAAKIGLSVSVANHYKRLLFESDIDIQKSNIILTGPTGTGKTLLTKTIAKFLNVPFAEADATTLTENGYIGDDADIIVSKLVAAAHGDVEAAERGIIFIDEIDKIARKANSSDTKDPGGAGVQSALLKIVEGTTLKVPVNGQKKHPGIPTVEINTENILFVVSGAFVGMNDIITDRLKKKSIGFGNSWNKNTDVMKQALPDDFVRFGMIPEFIGRFPVRVNTDDLSIENLKHIITGTDNSLLEQYKFYFSVDNIELEFTDDCLDAISQKAFTEKTGARGLRSIIDDMLMVHNYKLPDYKQLNATKLVFTRETVELNALPKILINDIDTEKFL